MDRTALHADSLGTPSLPLVLGPWLPLTDGETADCVERLDLHLRSAGLGEPAFSIQCQLHELQAVPLSFYPGWLLVTGQARLRDGASGTFDVLIGPGFFACLDGSAAMLQLLNRGQLPRAASADGAAAPCFDSPLARLKPGPIASDYMRFFCHAARSEQGAFRVVENLDDLQACGASGDLSAFAKALQPLRLAWQRGAGLVALPIDQPGAAHARKLTGSATLLHAGSLYRVRFRIDSTGGVEMLEDKLLAADLAPAEVNLQYLRNVRPAAAEEAQVLDGY